MEKINQEELKKIKELKGEVRGLSMKGHARFLLKEEGRKSLERVESEMKKLGYQFSYNNIKKLKFYPLSLYCTELLVIKKLFHYENELFKEIGEFNSKNSLIVKLFMKHFVSLGRMAKYISDFWRKYFSVGEMSVPEYDKNKKYVIIRIEDFNSTPLLCEITRGFSAGMTQMIVGQSGTCKETKCSCRGDDYHEFIFNW